MLILKILNDGSGSENFGNYSVWAFIGDDILGKGRVEGFMRSLGWKQLLLAAVFAVVHPGVKHVDMIDKIQTLEAEITDLKGQIEDLQYGDDL